MYLKAYANHLSGVQLWQLDINLQCNSHSQYIQCFLQAENSMTSRAYMGAVLTQVWLKSIKK